MLQKLKALSLIQKIAIGIVIGATLGFLFPKATIFALLGELFVASLKSIAPILVFALILASVAKHKKNEKNYLGSILSLYLVATFLASLVGVIASFLFPVTITLQKAVEQESPQEISEVIKGILMNVVQNPLQAIIGGNYLAVLFWASLLGFGLRKANEQIKEGIDTFAHAITSVVQFIISFAPVGIAGLVYHSVATTGINGLAQYGKLVILLVASMLFTALIIYPFMVFLKLRQNPYPLVFFCLKESAIPAFFTRSSAANIPINMKLANALQLEEESYSISIPLGATINMGGAAITISTMTLAAVHTLDIQVPLPLTLFLCLLSALSACGASGIAGGSLLLIPLACSLFGISNDIAMQVVGVGFVIGVIQDSFETALNSSSDLLFTATAELASEKRAGKKLSVRERLYRYQSEEIVD
ncbi:serine/threonine transporter [Pilibacter termitis]|uniref:Serine/threonine transporter SstT n=1 Tax=Pilibacter termitis TaxID=263852 RepID=A0A1T4N5Y3_9ENTE|nr:serine/threonine transporter SstT [Pilibacter termitis]SJZ74268.1 serine/threonine transporter [Pilibacter termitis]